MLLECYASTAAFKQNSTRVSKNSTTVASCSFDKHRLILIIVRAQHQHTFGHDMRIQPTFT